MSSALTSLRAECKPLAMAVAFEPARHHHYLSALLLLALECDKAILLPKEAMLRLIRLQWWIDALDSGATHNVPLMQDLHGLIDAGEIDKVSLIALVEHWQKAAEHPERLPDGWAALFVLLSGQSTSFSRLLGHNLCAVLQERPDQIAKTDDDKSAYNAGVYPAFMRASGLLVRRGALHQLQADGRLGLWLFWQMLLGRA